MGRKPSGVLLQIAEGRKPSGESIKAPTIHQPWTSRSIITYWRIAPKTHRRACALPLLSWGNLGTPVPRRAPIAFKAAVP